MNAKPSSALPSLCPQCGIDLDQMYGPHEATGYIDGGVMCVNRWGNSVDNRLFDTYLYIGSRPDPSRGDEGVRLTLVEEQSDGQFSLCFCSRKCLVAYLRVVAKRVREDGTREVL